MKTYRETVELSERHFESKGCVMRREKKGKEGGRGGEGQMKFCADPAHSALGGTVLADKSRGGKNSDHEVEDSSADYDESSVLPEYSRHNG